MTYDLKKKYAEQKYQVPMTYYDNGVEKTRKVPLCDVEMFIDDTSITLTQLVREVRNLTQANATKDETIKLLQEEIEKLKTFDLL